MKLHEELRKVESLLALQLKIGTNGLDTFLFNARVPFVPSTLCRFGRGRQTANHTLICCPRHAMAWHELKDEQEHLPDFSEFLGTAEGLQRTTKWMMQRGTLGQFWGPGSHSMALPSISPQHRTDFGFVFRYWRLQQALQMMYRQEEVAFS
jgi:hypothetical protein